MRNSDGPPSRTIRRPRPAVLRCAQSTARRFSASASTQDVRPYGIVGYTRLPRLAAEVRASWAKSARDRGEISELVPVRLKLDDVTAFIHENDLYDSVGLAACLSLIHHTSGHWNVESVTWSRLTERFVTLQEKGT